MALVCYFFLSVHVLLTACVEQMIIDRNRTLRWGWDRSGRLLRTLGARAELMVLASGLGKSCSLDGGEM